MHSIILDVVCVVHRSWFSAFLCSLYVVWKARIKQSGTALSRAVITVFLRVTKNFMYIYPRSPYRHVPMVPN
jgi:hypothetical protein